MKRNRICYLLAIIAMFTAFNVYAKTATGYAIKGWTEISGRSTDVKYNKGDKLNYEYWFQQVKRQDGQAKLRMFCTYPEKGSHNSSGSQPNMTCELMTDVERFKTSYQLLKLIQDRSVDDSVLDIAFRMAGMYDRIRYTHELNPDTNYQIRSFYDTYRMRVLGENINSEYYLKGAVVDQAVQLLNESKVLDVSDMKPTDNPQQQSTSIFSLKLISEDNNNHTKIYEITANRSLPNEPVIVGSNIEWHWVQGHGWNNTSGQIVISSLSNSNCNGTITVSAEVQVGNSSAIYDCWTNNSEWQHWIAIGPSRVGDTFDVSTCPTPDCLSPGCDPAEHKDEIKVIEIHNCCEEGGVTKLKQAALDELFCKDGTLNIEYYKPKCNAEEYIESDKTSAYCTMYCGSTVMYELPGPTRAKADAYFWFDKSKIGTTGPKLDQYKRCRNIIKFDVWLKDYKNNNEKLVEALNDYNKYITELNQINATAGQDKVETITMSCPPAAGQSVAQITRHEVHMTAYNVPSAIYIKFKSNLDTRNYNSMTIDEDGTGSSTSGTYYAQQSIDAYNNKVEELKRNNSNCQVSSTQFKSIDTARSEASDIAARALANYNSLVNASQELVNGIVKCNSNIKSKVQFNSEPEMEFSYNQVYMNDLGKLTSQELKIDFEKVDNKCVYETFDSLDKPDKNSEDWNKNWDIIGIYDSRYSANYGGGSLHVDTLKNINQSGSAVGSISSIKGSVESIGKMFTIDAVGHMSCRWQDSPKNKTYTLIPRGIVVTSESITGNIKDLGEQYTEREGTYQIVKTHAKGKFETYFTLRNIADGVFDDIIHEGGQTCAERDASIHAQPDKSKPEGVNTTCYIEVENNGFTLYDCTQNETIAKNDDVDNKCCTNGNCTGSGVLEYKEVDPANLLPNIDQYKDDPGYAWNWLKAEGAQQVLKDIQQKAADDKTYSKEELTYSFTLTPKALKEIRAYNKAVTKKGGYTDFNMDCKKETYNGATVLVQCKSKFLNAISGKGALPYGDGQKLDMNVSNKDLYNESRKDWN